LTSVLTLVKVPAAPTEAKVVIVPPLVLTTHRLNPVHDNPYRLSRLQKQ